MPDNGALSEESDLVAALDSQAIGITTSGRPSVVGKFIHIGTNKFYVKGVSYGAFRPDADKREY